MTTEALRLSADDLHPFFEPRHRRLAETLQRLFAHERPAFARPEDPATVAREMGEGLGLYAHLLPSPEAGARVDVRGLVLIREALGQVNPMADAIFAVQGLGTFPLARHGSEEQRRQLPAMIRGEAIGAFALTEPEAGSDVASLQTTAYLDGDAWVLDGEKCLISNVPLARWHVVFANADPSLGKKGITAFLVPDDAPGLRREATAMSVPHPLGRLVMQGCRVPASALLGRVGEGMRIALETLDTFRISVGAAACGMASRALSLALRHVQRRKQFGVALAEQQMVRATLAEMATELDAARLLVARAAHAKDATDGRVSTEAAMAKLYATEAAQRIIDKSLQLHGGCGVLEGSAIERLYREIRPLRIYEGTSEIQHLIIARGLLEGAKT